MGSIYAAFNDFLPTYIIPYLGEKTKKLFPADSTAVLGVATTFDMTSTKILLFCCDLSCDTSISQSFYAHMNWV